MSINRLVRALLTSVALVVLVVPAVVVVGGYVPDLPLAGRFGSYLISDLPYVAFLAIGATGLVGISVAIGGGGWTKLLGLLAIGVLGAILVAGAALVKTLSDNGAAYDVLRHVSADQGAIERKATERVVYTVIEGNVLEIDVWVPPYVESFAPLPPGRALVYVHGGGFVGGDLGMRSELFSFLAGRGYVVLDVEYRLSPPARWHDAPADVLCALAWLRANVLALGWRAVDPEQVVLMGESAGGNLALVAGYAAGTDAIEPSCDGEPIVPRGVVAVAPAIDLEALWSNPTLFWEGRPLPEAYVGGRPDELPDRYAAAEPFAYVRSDVPPTLLLAGANDQVIPLDHVRRLEDALRAAGAAVDVVVVPFADHGFDGFHDGPAGQLLETLIPAFIGEVTRE